MVSDKDIKTIKRMRFFAETLFIYKCSLNEQESYAIAKVTTRCAAMRRMDALDNF